MSAVDPKAVFRACLYIASLPIPSPAYEVGRTLLLMPERRWKKVLRRLREALPVGSPEREAAEHLWRIIVDGGSEVAA